MKTINFVLHIHLEDEEDEIDCIKKVKAALDAAGIPNEYTEEDELDEDMLYASDDVQASTH